MKRKNAVILATVWLMVMVGIAASTITLLTSGDGTRGTRWINSEQEAMLERYARLEEVRKALSEGHYMQLEEDALINGALRGMAAAAGDAYTLYYTPEEMQRHMDQTQGVYRGIGILLQNNEAAELEVLRVYEDSPADEAGMIAGDLILAVDGVGVDGESVQNFYTALELMKGEDGSELVLTVQRGQETLELIVRRGNVEVSNVSYELLDNGVGYINIYQFAGEAAEEFGTALDALQDADARALVIDLRNNPGGLLDTAVEVADRLLPAGSIVYTEDRNGSRRDYYSDAVYCELPVAVLINEMSASASEILAAAVQDFGRGTVIGVQSYGKGIVQTLLQFEDDGAGLQYTSACYYTPSGRNIHGTGVTPDVIVEAGEGFSSYIAAPNPEGDAQLRAALETLLKEINGEINT